MQQEHRSRAHLAQQLETTWSRVAEVAPELPLSGFGNPPAAVGSWLDDAADAAASRNYLLAQPADPPARTIYVEMNDFVFNVDRWMLSAFAFGPRASDAGVSVSAWFDALVGEELGDLRIPRLHLTGMDAAQEWFAAKGGDAAVEVADPMEDLVRLSMFDLLDRGLGRRRPLRPARGRQPSRGAEDVCLGADRARLVPSLAARRGRRRLSDAAASSDVSEGGLEPPPPNTGTSTSS